MVPRPEVYIVYEKISGQLFHLDAFSPNDAALKAAIRVGHRHESQRKFEVAKLDDFTTIPVEYPKPVLAQ